MTWPNYLYQGPKTDPTRSVGTAQNEVSGAHGGGSP